MTAEKRAGQTTPWPERAAQVLMTNYGPREIALVRGQGCRVWDDQGREYLDFLAGIAVCSLGHCHPAVVEALKKQSDQLHHVSNFFLIPSQIELGELLVKATGLDKCLFCNTGTEAMEGALKLARLYANKTYGPGKRTTVLSCTGSFHGRTYGSLSLTHSAKCRNGFEPFLPQVRFVEFNDAADLRRKMDDTVCAIVLEPIQGEGGITVAGKQFLSTARELADANDVCLILDEVQCGFSRTGYRFAYQAYEGIQPDVLALAKAMGSGVVTGAIVARGKWGEVFQPGNHGTTFGGNPLATTAALAVCRELLTPEMLEHVRETGGYLRSLLEEMVERRSVVEEVRGRGLMLGVVLNQPGAEVYKACLRRGLIINCTAQRVLRIVPPLIVTEQDCDRAAGILESALEEVFGQD
jgi:predicted acetylornithine/succinylornithine family transaminase